MASTLARATVSQEVCCCSQTPCSYRSQLPCCGSFYQWSCRARCNSYLFLGLIRQHGVCVTGCRTPWSFEGQHSSLQQEHHEEHKSRFYKTAA